MKKQELDTFIKRYSLDGLVSKSKWKYTVAEKVLHTRAAIDNKSFIVDVIMKEFADLGPDDLILCIGDTEKVSKMMSPFGEDIKVEINKLSDRILGFTMSDSNCQSYCTAADSSAMDVVPKNLADLPDWQVEVNLTEDFIEQFKKARAALKDINEFSINMNKKGLFEIVMGYSTSNSNRIRLIPPVVPTKCKIGDSLKFPIINIIAAIKANEDLTGGKMFFYDGGLTRLLFKSDKFECSYFQFCHKKQ